MRKHLLVFAVSGLLLAGCSSAAGTNAGSVTPGSQPYAAPQQTGGETWSQADTCIEFNKYWTSIQGEMNSIRDMDKTQGSAAADRWAAGFRKLSDKASEDLKGPFSDVAESYEIGSKGYWVDEATQKTMSEEMSQKRNPAMASIGSICKLG